MHTDFHTERLQIAGRFEPRTFLLQGDGANHCATITITIIVIVIIMIMCMSHYFITLQ